MHSRQLVILAFLVSLLGTPALLIPPIAECYTGDKPGPTQQFDFWGFSIAPEPETVGQKLELVGVIVPQYTWLPISLDIIGRQYTVYIHDLTLAERYQEGIGIISRYSGGYADVYEDASFDAPFSYNTDAEDVPPLDPSEVPANFTDGSLFARLEFLDFITIFYPSSGVGTIAYTDSELRVVGGWALPKFHRRRMTVGWHMGGGYTDDSRYIPEGYGMRYDPLIRWENPLPVEPTTWGKIKSTFGPSR